MTTLRSLSRNISWNYVEAVVSLVVYFLLTPVVVEHLGETGFGIWALLKTILYCLRFLDLGFYSALVKYVAEYSERREWPTVNGLIAATLTALTTAGVIALAGSGVIAWLLVPHVFQVPSARIPELQVATILIGINLLIAFPTTVLTAIFEGRQRFDVLSGITVLGTVLSAVATFAVLELGYDIIALVLVDIGTTVLSLVVMMVLLRRLLPELRCRFGRFGGSAFRQIREYSTWTSLNEVLVEGSVELEKLLLPIFLSVSLLTPYSLIGRVASVIFLAIEPITHVFFPLSSAYDAGSDRARLRDLLMRGSKIVMAISLPLAVAISAYGGTFILEWIGDEHVDVPPGVIPLVVASFVVTAFVSTPTTILLALAKTKEVFHMTVTELALAVILVVITVPRTGLPGLAGSLLVANALLTFFWTVPYTCRLLEQGTAAYLGQSLIRPLLATVPMILGILWLNYQLPGTSIPWLVLKSGIAGGIYLGAFWLVSLTSEERVLYASSARQMVRGAME